MSEPNDPGPTVPSSRATRPPPARRGGGWLVIGFLVGLVIGLAVGWAAVVYTAGVEGAPAPTSPTPSSERSSAPSTRDDPRATPGATNDTQAPGRPEGTEPAEPADPGQGGTR